VRAENTRLFGTARTRVEPVGIAEMGIPDVTVPAPGTGSVDSGCRSDLLAIDGHAVPVRVTGRASAAQSVMGLAVTPCAGPLRLGAGPHVLTTAEGKNVGLSIDRLALASGTAAVPVRAVGGHVSVSAPAPAPPAVSVVHGGDTKVRVHVTGAGTPFWLVLGESQSPGWHARVVDPGGHDLGSSQLVDGYANGWLVTPPASGSFDVVFEWTPQRQVRTAIWLSLVGVLLCLGVIGTTWVRRRVIATAATPLPGDADVDLGWVPRAPDGSVSPRVRGRIRWLAPLVSGLIAALVVAPWIGVLTAAIVVGVVARPRLRPFVMLAPGALLGLCGLYIVVEQARYRYPSVFEWPTVFPHARTLAWIAVMILMADGVVEILRSGPARGPNRKSEPEADPGAP
jgi:arabinofuranan 3-O-arabinosyltransferase